MKISIKGLIKNACFWLAIISVILLFGVILFTVYLYKIDLLSLIDFRTLFYGDDNTFSATVLWTAIGALSAAVVGVFTVVNNYYLYKLQKRQLDHQTIPHVMLKRISIVDNLSYQLSSDGTRIKRISGISFPLYTNTKGHTDDPSTLTMLVLNFHNTSSVFAKISLTTISISDHLSTFAEYNGSSIGYHDNYLFLCGNSSDSLGLLVEKDLLARLRGAELKVSIDLLNDSGERFRDTHTFRLINSCDDTVITMPAKADDNSFVQIS